MTPTTTNNLFKETLDRLIRNLNQLTANDFNKLEPIRGALQSIYSRGMEPSKFLVNLKELSKAIIDVRQDAVRKDANSSYALRRLPVPPYDLWLPFIASESSSETSKDFTTVSQILSSGIRDLDRILTELPIRGKETSNQNPESVVRDQIFISYCSEDIEYLDRLQKHFKPYLDKSHKDIVWSDKSIKPGEQWRESIEAALKRAKAAVLLVTPGFLASEFIMEQELPEILLGVDAKQLQLFWISVKPSGYQKTRIAGFQCLNNPRLPLSVLNDGQRDEQMVEICQKIFDTLNGESKSVSAGSSRW